MAPVVWITGTGARLQRRDRLGLRLAAWAAGTSRGRSASRDRRLGGGRAVRVPHVPDQRGAAPQHHLPRLPAPGPRRAAPLPEDGRAAPRWARRRCCSLQGLSSNYHLLYGALLLGLVHRPGLAARPRQTARPAAAGCSRRAVAARALRADRLALPAESRGPGLARELPAGIDLRALRVHAAHEPRLRRIGGPVRLQQQGPHFVGFVSLALAALAVAAWARGAADAERTRCCRARVWVPAAAAWPSSSSRSLSGRDVAVFGHELGPGPYRLLYATCPASSSCASPSGWPCSPCSSWRCWPGAGSRSSAARRAAVARCSPPWSPSSTSRRAPGRARARSARRAGRLSLAGREPVRGAGGDPRPRRGPRPQGDARGLLLDVPLAPVIHGYTATRCWSRRCCGGMAAEFPSEASLQALPRVGVDTAVVHHGRGSRRPAPPARRRRRRAFAAAARGRPRPLRPAGPAVAAGRIAGGALRRRAAARLREHGRRGLPHPPPPRCRPRPSPPAAASLARRGAIAARWATRARGGRRHGDGVDGRARSAATSSSKSVRRPLPVTGLVLRLRRDSAFPTRLRVGGRDATGAGPSSRASTARTGCSSWTAARRPARGGLGFDLPGRELTGLACSWRRAARRSRAGASRRSRSGSPSARAC